MKTKGNNPYQVINFIFLLILAGVMLYAALFSPEKGNHPIPSSAALVSAHPVPSTGLSRSFSAMVRFRFDDALRYNPYGPRVFLFFFIQLILRLTLVISLPFVPKVRRVPNVPMVPKVPIVPFADIIFSLLLLIYCFYPFLKALLIILF